jgi:hypothetical protein
MSQWTELELNEKPYRWCWLESKYADMSKRLGTVNGEWLVVEGFNEHLNEWRVVRSVSTIGKIATSIRP